MHHAAELPTEEGNNPLLCSKCSTHMNTCEDDSTKGLTNINSNARNLLETMENKNEAASNVQLTSEQRTCSYCDNLKRRLFTNLSLSDYFYDLGKIFELLVLRMFFENMLHR
jgi:thioredoxin-related protein